MSDVLAWFDYKWNFDFPVEMFGAIRGRLAGTPARLEELLRGAQIEVAQRPAEGKWSVQEEAGHLWTLEELWELRLGEFLKGVKRLAAADLTNRATHEAGFNTMPLEKVLGGFRAARKKTMDRLDRLTLADAARAAEHPRLGVQMRLVDLAYFVAEHDDHHLAVMREKLRTAR